MNTCKKTSAPLVANFSKVEDNTRYNYKVVGRLVSLHSDVAGEVVVLHRCNSETEAQRVQQSELGKNIFSGKYSDVWWQSNK